MKTISKIQSGIHFQAYEIKGEERMINDLLTILKSWRKCQAYDDYIKQLENLNG